MGRRRIYTGEWDIKLRELYLQGMSLYEIHRQYGIHPNTVKERLIEQGVSIRDKDQAIENSKINRKGKNGKKTESKRANTSTPGWRSKTSTRRILGK